MPKSLVLFIDAANFYQDAREAFFSQGDGHVYGQTNPIKLGELIASRIPFGEDKQKRELKEVRIFTGRPEGSKDPKTYAAYQRQKAAWSKLGAIVQSRTLRYPPNWPHSRAQQKGVDVQMAVEFVVMAIEGGFDVGVLASTDTDLRPALEYVMNQGKVIGEVTSWIKKPPKQLTLPGHRVWCHRLSKADYDLVADYRDYNLP